jgi:hypothetical protein
MVNDPPPHDKKFAETLSSIAALKAGVKTYIAYGKGPWIDVSEQTLRRLQQDTIAEKRRHLELYESRKITFRFGEDPRTDTTSQIVDRIKAEIALIESTL